MRRGRCQPPDGTGPVGAALSGASPGYEEPVVL